MRTRPAAGYDDCAGDTGTAKGTDALKQHLEEHRREARR
jgi:hypothetical protein